MNNERNGVWIDDCGACKVCDGEIPHGHTNECDIFKLEKKIHDLTHVLSENGKLSLDDFNVRNVLLECLALLGVENIAAADECRTLDVAEVLKDKLIERSAFSDGYKDALESLKYDEHGIPTQYPTRELVEALLL